MRKALFIVVLVTAFLVCSACAGCTALVKNGCSLPDGSRQTLDAHDCFAKVNEMQSQRAHDQVLRDKASDEQRARKDAEFDAAHPVNQKFLDGFLGVPQEKRFLVYDRIDLMTDRDYADQSPEDVKTITCLKSAKKIDIQRAYERLGSHGIYDVDLVLSLAPPSCRSFLEKMSALKD